MTQRRLCLFAVVALLPSLAYAGGTCSGVKGGCGRSAFSSSARSSSPGGTVHVSGYYRKDGTYVRPHDRRAPGTAAVNYRPDPEPEAKPPPVKVRTAPRTSARITAWNGNVTDVEEPAPPVARTRPPSMPVAEPQIRNWTDKSGAFTVMARFGGMAGTTVTLHKTDGTTIKVQLDQLCQADQDWIAARRR